MFVLGLCTLLSMSGGRPPVLNDEAHRILPSLILVFKGLKRAYECKMSTFLDFISVLFVIPIFCVHQHVTGVLCLSYNTTTL